jgi:hypothetical protein
MKYRIVNDHQINQFAKSYLNLSRQPAHRNALPFMIGAITKRFIPTLSVLSRPMSVTVQGSRFKLALVQLAVTGDKEKNLKHARDKVLEASKNGANIVVLPVQF